MLSSPTAAAALSASRDLGVGRRLQERGAVVVERGRRGTDPGAGEAVGLQLEAYAVRRRSGGLHVEAAHQAGDVLDVVAPLVPDHVQLGERAAARSELLLQLVEERGVDVDRSGRAGSRTDRPSSSRRRTPVLTEPVKRTISVGVAPSIVLSQYSSRDAAAPFMRQSRFSLASSPVWHCASGGSPVLHRRRAGVRIHETAQVDPEQLADDDDGQDAQTTAADRDARVAAAPAGAAPRDVRALVERHATTVARADTPRTGSVVRSAKLWVCGNQGKRIGARCNVRLRVTVAREGARPWETSPHEKRSGKTAAATSLKEKRVAKADKKAGKARSEAVTEIKNR